VKTRLLAAGLLVLGNAAAQASADCSREIACIAATLRAERIPSAGDTRLKQQTFRHLQSSQGQARASVDRCFDQTACGLKKITPWKEDEDGRSYVIVTGQDGTWMVVTVEQDLVELTQVEERIE